MRRPEQTAQAPEALSYRPVNGGGQDTGGDEAFYLAMGYRRFVQGETVVAVRSDALERLAAAARKLAAQGSFGITPALRRVVGCSEQELALLADTGVRKQRDRPVFNRNAVRRE